MSTAEEHFMQKITMVMNRLVLRFGLVGFQAAGVGGNLGHESEGLTLLRELGASHGNGGYGWGQWTGPRGREFLGWCKNNRLDWRSDSGNLGFLCHELGGAYGHTISALHKTKNLEQATIAFERNYERAGVVSMSARLHWANLALRAFNHES